MSYLGWDIHDIWVEGMNSRLRRPKILTEVDLNGSAMLSSQGPSIISGMDSMIEPR